MSFSRSFGNAARKAGVGAPRVVARRAALTTLIGAVAITAYAADSERVAATKSLLSGVRNEAWQRYAAHCDAAVAEKQQVGTLTVDPATSVQHPAVLSPASAPDLALVGIGVRTVSFLRMKVYSAGFYVDSYALKKLASLPAWAGYTPEALSGPKAEELIQSLLNAPAAMAVRIIPVRNTDFSHLRDGLTRTLLARQKAQRNRGAFTPEDEERLVASVQTFKGIFPAGSVPKGKELTLVRSADGHLHVEYEGKVLGHVHDKWMADNLMLAYFDPASPISAPLRDSAAEGFRRVL